MVSYSVFNELSLPLKQHQAYTNFREFFKVFKELKQCGLGTIRMSDNFKNYNILAGVTFQHFLGQQQDRDFKNRLRSFIANTVIKIEEPIIKKTETKQLKSLTDCEYFYNKKSTEGGLACCDIWNTVAISFDSDSQWSRNRIPLQKSTLTKEGEVVLCEINIKHASSVKHLSSHQHFFNELENEIKLGITQKNLWLRKDELFSKRISLCPEVESQIKNLDKNIFQQAISMLRDVETQRKLITDYKNSGEGETIRKNPKLGKERMFTVEGKKIFFEDHVKSLPNGCRIYFLEQKEKIHIGYIGKHLKGKRE